MPVFFEKLAGLQSDVALPQPASVHLRRRAAAVAVAQAFAARFGRKIHGFYGSSECGGIAYDASEERDWKPGFVGTPMQRREHHAREPWRTANADHRAERSRGRWLLSGAGRTQCSAAGSFIPGDLVEFDGPAMLLTGRASDVINIAGRKLNPGGGGSPRRHLFRRSSGRRLRRAIEAPR